MELFVLDASIVICTRNRAESLARTLLSLEHLVVPDKFEWNLVIVDNGSTDGTVAVVETFAERLPIILVHEPMRGLSNARNRGVAAASGKYVIWTDDDVVVAPGWLAAYSEAFRRWPDAALFGGPILPVLEEPSPAWFVACRGELEYLLAARDFGEAPVALSPESKPFGANFVLLAEEQRRWMYDPELGAGAGRGRVGEEVTVIDGILASGRKGFYVPNAVVRHMIPRQRQTLSYVRAYYRAHGETAAVIEQARPASLPGRLPLWLIRRIVTEGWAYWRARLFESPPIYVRRLKRFAFSLGYAEFLRSQARTDHMRTWR